MCSCIYLFFSYVFSSFFILIFSFFFFNDTATTEIYTLSLHDALPIFMDELKRSFRPELLNRIDEVIVFHALSRENVKEIVRSEEHTSELQSRVDLVCRLLLEKKKKKIYRKIKRKNKI